MALTVYAAGGVKDEGIIMVVVILLFIFHSRVSKISSAKKLLALHWTETVLGYEGVVFSKWRCCLL